MIARCASLVLLLTATAASAQEWSGRLALYGWLPSAELDTTIDRPGGGVSGDASSGVSDILDALNFAAFATVEARRGRLGLIGDFIYTDLGVDSTGPGGVRRGSGFGAVHGHRRRGVARVG